MVLRIENFNIGIALNVAGNDIPFSFNVNDDGFGTGFKQLCVDTFHIQNDFGHVFLNTGNRGNFMEHSVDFYVGNRYTGEGTEKNSSQRISQRNTETSFQRFDFKTTVGSIRILLNG